MYEDLRRWFNSVCNCDGFNNLHNLNLMCINYTTGVITTMVYFDGDQSAQMLIDLMVADIEGSDPPAINVSPDWVVCLNPNCNWDFNHSSSDVGSGMRNKALLDLYVKNLTDCHRLLNVSCIENIIIILLSIELLSL